MVWEALEQLCFESRRTIQAGAGGPERRHLGERGRCVERETSLSQNFGWMKRRRGKTLAAFVEGDEEANSKRFPVRQVSEARGGGEEVSW